MTPHDDRPIAARAASGAVWLVASRLGTRAIDFASLLLLARILTPADFGMVAIAMTLVQIVEAVFELPVGQILVRADTIERGLLETAFTLSLLRGGALAGVLAGLALPFSYIYGEHRLFPLICFLSAAPALRGLISPAMAHFARAIDFRRDLIIEMSGKVCAFALALALALLTHSYWAIALGTVAAPAAMVAVSYRLAPFRPRLSLAGWRTFAGFLGWTTAAQAISALNWQADRLILGRFVSRAELGGFSLASDVSTLPEQAMVKPIMRPLLSAFSLIRDQPVRLAEAYLRTAATVLAVGAPVMLGLSLLAEPAVRLLLGGKWTGAWPYLQWLALTLIPPLFTAPLAPLAMALGRTRLFLQQNAVEFAIKIPAIIVCAWQYGIYGVIGARGASAVAMALVTGSFVRRLTGIPVWRQLAASTRTIVAGAALAAVLIALRPLLDGLAGVRLALALGAVAGGGIGVYAAIMLLLWNFLGKPAGLELAVYTRAKAMVSGQGIQNLQCRGADREAESDIQHYHHKP